MKTFYMLIIVQFYIDPMIHCRHRTVDHPGLSAVFYMADADDSFMYMHTTISHIHLKPNLCILYIHVYIVSSEQLT